MFLTAMDHTTKRHIFIINPHAGSKRHTDEVAEQVRQLNIGAEMYVTRCPRDATRIVEDFCNRHSNEPLRFYACGGDGTLGEVVSGVLRHPAAEVGCFPCGSGNDYVKYWPDIDFRDIRALVSAPSVPVDLMRVSTGDEKRYCINMMNLGFEAAVCRNMDMLRSKPVVGGRMAYTSGIVYSLLNDRHHPCRISLDGEAWHEGDIMLGSLANGRYAGGGYCCAPRSVNDDGILDAMIVRPISVARFATLISLYRKGLHLDSPKMRDMVEHRRCRRAVVESQKPLCAALDGEVLCSSHFEIENIQHGIRFLLPSRFATAKNSE